MAFVKDDIAYLPLQVTRGARRLFALVDAEDFDRVRPIKWFGSRSGRTVYVRATSSKGLPAHHESLHAFILKVKPGERVDHKNGNGLDCRKINLRPATAAQNSRNSLKTDSTHVTSKFKGVTLTSSGRWGASITFEAEVTVLGLFDREEDAARAYDEAAVRLFGEFAKTNADMGLFDGPLQRDNSGADIKTTLQLGTYHASDRHSLDIVVGISRHKRNKALLYRLASGRTVHPSSYIGPPVPAEDIERMKRERHDFEAARRSAHAA